MLKLPRFIHQEDGTRDLFEKVFQQMDVDDSKSISSDEWAAFVGRFARAVDAAPKVALGASEAVSGARLAITACLLYTSPSPRDRG